MIGPTSAPEPDAVPGDLPHAASSDEAGPLDPAPATSDDDDAPHQAAPAPATTDDDAPHQAAPAPTPATTDDDDDEPRTRPSYRERKQASEALAELARALVEMKPSQLAEVPLPDEVRREIEICRAFRRGPRVRQLRRISQMIRRLDIDVVTTRAHDAGHKQRGRAKRERIYEQWRERLVSEGDRALTEFVDRHPMVEPKRLRQLLRQARRDPGSGNSKQALLAVLRLVREALETEADVTQASDED